MYVVGQATNYSGEILKNATVSCKKISATGFSFLFSTIDEALEDLI